MFDDQEQIIKDFAGSLDLTTPTLTSSWVENESIEFKKSLHTKGETIDKGYAKTISAFANNSGGTIIFGIDPDSRELIGINEKYRNLDNRYVSDTIKTCLDGPVQAHFFTKTFLDRIIGFLYVEEAKSKPVIMKVDAGELKLGEIYYRYSALSSKICAGELRKIILDEITKNVNKTLEHFKSIVEVGGENIAILNTNTGEIKSSDHNLKLSLDEVTLQKLNLIKKGELVQEKGAPAYIIKGEIEVERNTVIEKTVPMVLSEEDIFKIFYTGHYEFPDVAIRQILSLKSGYIPIHIFVKLCKSNTQKMIDYITFLNDNNISEATRTKVLKRLQPYDYKSQGKIIKEISMTINPDNTLEENIQEAAWSIDKAQINDKLKLAIVRTLIFNSLNKKCHIPKVLLEDNMDKFLEAIGNITREVFLENVSYYFDILQSVHDSIFYSKSTALLLYRKVICKFDDWIYREN